MLFFLKKKKANRMPILIRFLTKELLVSYPYSVKKYIFFLKKKNTLLSCPYFKQKYIFSNTKFFHVIYFFYFLQKTDAIIPIFGQESGKSARTTNNTMSLMIVFNFTSFLEFVRHIQRKKNGNQDRF